MLPYHLEAVCHKVLPRLPLATEEQKEAGVVSVSLHPVIDSVRLILDLICVTDWLKLILNLTYVVSQSGWSDLISVTDCLKLILELTYVVSVSLTDSGCTWIPHECLYQSAVTASHLVWSHQPGKSENRYKTLQGKPIIIFCLFEYKTYILQYPWIIKLNYRDPGPWGPPASAAQPGLHDGHRHEAEVRL